MGYFLKASDSKQKTMSYEKVKMQTAKEINVLHYTFLGQKAFRRRMLFLVSPDSVHWELMPSLARMSEEELV